jgi:hypothetical protein
VRRSTLELLARADELIRATARRLRGNRAILGRLDRLKAGHRADFEADDTGEFTRPMSHASPIRDALDEASSGRADYVPSWAVPEDKKRR